MTYIESAANMKNKKKQAMVMISGVIIFWIIVIIILIVKRGISKKTSDDLGQINIKREEKSEYDDPYKDVEGIALTDNGFVVIYDNEDNLSKKGFITSKGHVFLPDKLTSFLSDNGYADTESITVIPSSCTSDSYGSSFVASIDGSSMYIKISQDYSSEELTFQLLKEY